MKWKLLGLAGLWSVAGLAAAADTAAPAWITDSHGCKVANPHPVQNETIDWSGACPDGFAEGKGQLRRLENGRLLSTYDGEMKAGRYSGQGRVDKLQGRSLRRRVRQWPL